MTRREKRGRKLEEEERERELETKELEATKRKVRFDKGKEKEKQLSLLLLLLFRLPLFNFFSAEEARFCNVAAVTVFVEKRSAFAASHLHCPYHEKLARNLEVREEKITFKMRKGLSLTRSFRYGERGFRYCQLDVGHAIGALSTSAALLQWHCRPLWGISDESLAKMVGCVPTEEMVKVRRSRKYNFLFSCLSLLLLPVLIFQEEVESPAILFALSPSPFEHSGPLFLENASTISNLIYQGEKSSEKIRFDVFSEFFLTKMAKSGLERRRR